MAKKVELSIAIPFYNEEENVDAVVREMCSLLEKEQITYELVLVNNGSRDKTGELLDKMENPSVRVVHLIANAGYGGGIITGLHYCKGAYLGYTWGDNQIKAEDVAHIYKSLKEDGADWGKGTRVKRYYSFQRKIISKIYNIIYKTVFNVNSKDINGVPKIFKRETYQMLDIISTDWFIDAEIMYKSQKQNLKFIEIPVIFHERTKGGSNVNMLTVVEFVVNLIQFWRDKRFGN